MGAARARGVEMELHGRERIDRSAENDERFIASVERQGKLGT